MTAREPTEDAGAGKSEELSALRRIETKLRATGATIPFGDHAGTIESAMRAGLSIALLLVLEEIDAARGGA